MATELRLRRGTTDEHGNFIGAEAEATVDTDKNTIVVHDGQTQGGFPLSQEDTASTYSDLKSKDVSKYTDGYIFYVGGRVSVGDGGEGYFRWDSSDLSTEVGNDEVTANEGDGGIYVAPASDKTGASGAWVRSTQVVIPEFYGAKGDGSTDDAASLQGALNSGYRVYAGAPTKTYLLGSTVTIPSDSWIDLSYATVLVDSNFSGNYVLESVGESNARIANLLIDGGDKDQRILLIENCGDVSISNLSLSNVEVTDFGHSVVRFLGSSNIRIEGGVFSNVNDVNQSGRQCFRINDCSFVEFTGLNFRTSCYGRAIAAVTSDNVTIKHCQVEGQKRVDAGEAVFFLSGLTNSKLLDCNIEGAGGNLIKVSENCNYVVIDGVFGRSFGQFGVVIEGSHHIHIKNCVLDTQVSGSSEGILISDDPDTSSKSKKILMQDCYIRTSSTCILFVSSNLRNENIEIKDCVLVSRAVRCIRFKGTTPPLDVNIVHTDMYANNKCIEAQGNAPKFLLIESCHVENYNVDSAVELDNDDTDNTPSHILILNTTLCGTDSGNSVKVTSVNDIDRVQVINCIHTASLSVSGVANYVTSQNARIAWLARDTAWTS